MQSIKIFFSLILLLSFAACKENKEAPTPGESGPYTLDYPFYFGEPEIPTDNALTHEGVRLGRALFYEEKLSKDNSISCASCHKQELAFTDGLPVSVGFAGRQQTVGSMGLANLAWNTRFNWDGRAASLEEQAFGPIEHPNEMNQSLEETVRKLQATEEYPPLFKAAFGSETITDEKITKALAQFIRTLVSQDSKYDQYLRGEYQPTDLELRGIELFFTHPEPSIGLRGGNCGDCHLGPQVSGDPEDFRGFHNNGLDSEGNLRPGLSGFTGQPEDRGKFKAPSLRNIALTAPYMHDGRFATLEEVLAHYNEHVQRSSTLDPLIIEASNELAPEPDGQIRLHLTEDEKEAILAFLNMLSDEAFLTNPEFSDPGE